MFVGSFIPYVLHLILPSRRAASDLYGGPFLKTAVMWRRSRAERRLRCFQLESNFWSVLAVCHHLNVFTQTKPLTKKNTERREHLHAFCPFHVCRLYVTNYIASRKWSSAPGNHAFCVTASTGSRRVLYIEESWRTSPSPSEFLS